ncbi:MAG TPA: hypothetical protein VK797_06000 [Tepidisphaeraceae bacterium]|jgi:hypothetical protein|nr:hypothetical protein [Tepidisphaeraceae bacterium]
MQEQDGLSTEQQELELALRSVAPAAARVDPVSAAFAAGLASGRRQIRFWRATAVIVLATGIASQLLPGGHGGASDSPHDRPGSVLVVRQESSEPPLPEQSVLMLQRAMEKQGAEGLPAAPLCPVQTLHAGDVL